MGELETEKYHCVPSSRREASEFSLWRLVDNSDKVIVRLNDTTQRRRLYFVHPIAGDLTVFKALADSLNSTYSCYGFQVPKGRMNSEFAVSIEAIANTYVKLLLSFQPEGPIILGGWSAGAIIALEMGQQLRRAGRNVPLLIALDGAPCNTDSGISRWNPLYSLRLFCNFPDWLRLELDETGSAKAFARQVLHKVAFRRQLSPHCLKNNQTLDGEAAQAVMGEKGWSNAQTFFIQALFLAMQRYTPQVYDGRVLLFEAKTQPLDHLRQVGRAWEKIAIATERVLLKGNHKSLSRERTANLIAMQISCRLKNSEESIAPICSRKPDPSSR